MTEEKEIVEELLKNPKIRKAIKGILKPLKQDGDSLTIENLKEKELRK